MYVKQQQQHKAQHSIAFPLSSAVRRSLFGQHSILKNINNDDNVLIDAAAAVADGAKW